MEDFTHVINWDKVTELKDVVELLKGFDIKIDPDKINPRLKKYLTPINGE